MGRFRVLRGWDGWQHRGTGSALRGSVGQRKVGGRAEKGGSIMEGTSGCRGPGEGHSRAGMVSAPHVLGTWGNGG